VAVWLAPAPGPATPVAALSETPAQRLALVQNVIEQRCLMCHNAQLASKGVRLDSPEALNQHAQNIYQQAVVLKAMPMNNATQITDAERAVLARWFKSLP
jgi:uncharacterized membrane protein